MDLRRAAARCTGRELRRARFGPCRPRRSRVGAGVAAKKAPAADFPAASLIIEFNASAEDVGVQFFLDADEWQTVRILDPSGKEVFQSTARGRLLDQGGGTELFVESVEPELIELPLDEFFEIFPAGTYTFLGRTPDGERLSSAVEFTHVIPAGPEIVLPVGQLKNAPKTCQSRPSSHGTTSPQRSTAARSRSIATK